MKTKKKLNAMKVKKLSLTFMNDLKGGIATIGTPSTNQKYHRTYDGCGDHYYDIYDDNGCWIGFTKMVKHPC